MGIGLGDSFFSFFSMMQFSALYRGRCWVDRMDLHLLVVRGSIYE